MSTTTAKRLYTPEDLLRLPDAKSYELVDGKLVKRSMGCEASWIGGRLYYFLHTFCSQNRRGWVFPADASYQCFRDAPFKVRKPDVSFIRLERLARPPRGHLSIHPDAAAEVISPHELFTKVEVKIGEYLHAGVQLVWVINPSGRSVHVYRDDGSVTKLSDADDLDGENVITGFCCKVADLFDEPSAPSEAH